MLVTLTPSPGCPARYLHAFAPSITIRTVEMHNRNGIWSRCGVTDRMRLSAPWPGNWWSRKAARGESRSGVRIGLWERRRKAPFLWLPSSGDGFA